MNSADNLLIFQITRSGIMEAIFDVGMAVCPVFGYIMQTRLIHKNESVGAFSTDICLVLLVANILRLNFYPFKHFETALIFQSLFMIIAQLVLLQACTQYNEILSNDDEDNPEKQKFWRWSTFTPYWVNTLLFTTGTFSFTFIMWAYEVQLYGQVVGFIALMTESVLILPQIIHIFQVGFSEGISISLLALNLSGDTLKTIYFFYNNQPFQFKMCGVIQLILDSFVILQIIYYHHIKVKIHDVELDDENKKTNTQTKEGNNYDLENSISRSIVMSENIDKQNDQSVAATTQEQIN